MTAPSYLDTLSTAAVTAWLRDAMHGQVPLDRLAPDEYPYIAVLRLELRLQRSTRTDLEHACRALILELTRAPEACDADYSDNLLRLAVGLRLDDLTQPLALLAEQPALTHTLRRRVLAALIDLRLPQPSTFWDRIFDRIGEELTDDTLRLAITTFSGLLASSREQAIARLPKMPDHPRVADSLVGAFDGLLSELHEPMRSELLLSVRNILPRCGPALRRSLIEWLQDHNFPANDRDYRKVDALLRRVNGEFRPTPCSARL